MCMKSNYMNTKNILFLAIGIVSVLLIVVLAVAVSVVRSQLQLESMPDVEVPQDGSAIQDEVDTEVILQKRAAFLEYESTLPPVNAETQRATFLEYTPEEDSDEKLEKRRAFLEAN